MNASSHHTAEHVIEDLRILFLNRKTYQTPEKAVGQCIDGALGASLAFNASSAEGAKLHTFRMQLWSMYEALEEGLAS